MATSKAVPSAKAPAAKKSTTSFTDRLVKRFKDENTVTFKSIDNFGNVNSWISTGSPSLDYHLNTWGYPSGIIEMRGVSKSGKTTLSLHAMKIAYQINPDVIIVILSTERRDNKPYAKQIGVPLDKVIVHQVTTIEQVFNRIQQTITEVELMWKEEEREGKPKFIFVWDSLGASIAEQERKKMVSAAEEDTADHANAAMAAAAKATKRGLRFMVGQVYDRDICFYIINHTYDKIGSFTGGQESYGGKAIQFMPTMRLEATFTGQVKIGEVKVGQTTKVTVIKSDYTSDLAPHEIEIGYGLGLILTEDDMEFGVEAGYVKRAGLMNKNGTPKKGAQGYSFMNGKLEWHDRKGLYELYRTKNKFLQVLIRKLTKTVHDKVLAKRDAAMAVGDEE
jgi:recombination protein RecA